MKLDELRDKLMIEFEFKLDRDLTQEEKDVIEWMASKWSEEVNERIAI